MKIKIKRDTETQRHGDTEKMKIKIKRTTETQRHGDTEKMEPIVFSVPPK